MPSITGRSAIFQLVGCQVVEGCRGERLFAREQYFAGQDPQLDKAIEVLMGKIK